MKKFEKEKVFEIRKDNENIGRIEKNSKYVGKRGEFCEDDVIGKMKGRFHEKCGLAINK